MIEDEQLAPTQGSGSGGVIDDEAGTYTTTSIDPETGVAEETADTGDDTDTEPSGDGLETTVSTASMDSVDVRVIALGLVIGAVLFGGVGR